MDPLSLVVGGAVVAFVNSIGPRLIQALIPTKFDQAQVLSIANQRDRLVLEERRFETQMREARERMLIEHQQRLELAERAAQLSRWPMEFLPADYIRRSGDSNGRSLNVIVRQSDHRRGPSADPANMESTARLLKDALFVAEDQMLKWYTGDRFGSRRGGAYNGVLFYPDYRLHAAKDIQSIVSVLSSLTYTEPSVLIDIAVLDRLVYRVTISHWGAACSDGPRAITLPPVVVNLSSLVNDETKARIALSVTMSSIVASIADTFHLLRRPHELPVPAMFELISHGGNVEDPASYWKPISESYRTGLAHLAERSPLLASELSANAALAAHGAKQGPYADSFLENAVRYFRQIHHKELSEFAVLKKLHALRTPCSEPFRLQVALESIRGHVFLPEDQPEVEAKQPGTLSSLYASLGPTKVHDA